MVEPISRTSKSDLEDRYFLGSADSATVPRIDPGNQVTPLINGAAYLVALYNDLQRLGRNPRAKENAKEFIYIAGWVLNLSSADCPLFINLPGGPARLIDILKEKARAGVDVRVLPWFPWNLAKIHRIDIRPETCDNTLSAQELRREPALANKVCLNIVSHPAGSAHMKMVILGSKEWSAGYTGGIDLAPDRFQPGWLDVQARVEGPAVQSLYDLFRDIWNQNLVFASQQSGGGFIRRLQTLIRSPRPVFFQGKCGPVASVVPGTPPVEPRELPAGPRGVHLVQSLEALPAFKFSFSPLVWLWRVAPLSFAPEGTFQIREAVRKAIQSARSYLYIEDQYFWSAEVLRWVGQAVRANPDLRVILLTGTSDQLGERLDANRVLAVLEGLFLGLSAQQRQQIGFFQREEMVHGKTILVDDRWALIGSANIARRSLYMDIEHAIAFASRNDSVVRDYRVALWADRLGLEGDSRERLAGIDQALNLWDARWGAPAGGKRIQIPARRIFDPPPPCPDIDREWYEMVDDPDSRQPWYFPLRRSYKRYERW